MSRSERIARMLIGAAVFAAVAVPLALWWRSPLVHARMADDGGWSPDTMRAQVGVPLELHLTSDDVVHGFAVGKLDLPAVDILPGKVTDIALLFDEPGTYTFYCTRWCGLNHWRMRGTIEVTGESKLEVAGESGSPLYAELGLDLDAPRSAAVIPDGKPLAAAVDSQLSNMLADYVSSNYYRAHSPAEAWQELRADSAFRASDDQALWRFTAAVWQANTTPEELADGGQLFAQNCAACHGEVGGGDGVFADDLDAAAMPGTISGAAMWQPPADLTDPVRVLAASPALLQGKILRGGMGTGMPSWGAIFTAEQAWSLVAYIYSFQFTYR
jgi:mono/diheme cytochrome c family protein/plastocyanin